MNNKHLNRSAIGRHNAEITKTKYLNKNHAVMQGWLEEGDKANVFISIRFIQHDFECFSDWDKAEMKAFWAFIDKAHQYTWQMIKNQSGKFDKTGLAYTEIPIKKYPESDFRKSLDPLITLFELRVNQKIRVHCFRDKSICYVCWLDKNHRICN